MIRLKHIRALAENDGITLKDGQPIVYKSGWQVADCGVECRTAEAALKAVHSYNGTCGVWYSEGIYYVDHSFRVNTKHEALEIGRLHSQISIYGWKTGKLAYC